MIPRPAPLPGAGDSLAMRGPAGLSGLMTDPRVKKGSRYSSRPHGPNQSNGLPTRSVPGMGAAPARRVILREKWSESRASTPPPAQGRTNCLLQTDEYIEILTNNSSNFQQTQTIAAMDRPADPLFNRKKQDADVTTQLEDGDIFAFDIDVEPVIEVLMRTTFRKSKLSFAKPPLGQINPLTQPLFFPLIADSAMLELVQEEELEAIEREREGHELQRNSELAEVQRLEQEKRRVEDERRRRLEQTLRYAKKQKDLEERLAARAVATRALDDLRGMAFRTMDEAGILVDPLRQEIEQDFMPGLLQAVLARSRAQQLANELIDDLLEDAKGNVRRHEARRAVNLIAETHATEYRKRVALCSKLSASFALLDKDGSDQIPICGLLKLVSENSMLRELLIEWQSEQDLETTIRAAMGATFRNGGDLLLPHVGETTDDTSDHSLQLDTISRERFVLILSTVLSEKSNQSPSNLLPSFPEWPTTVEFESIRADHVTEHGRLPPPHSQAPSYRITNPTDVSGVLSSLCGNGTRRLSDWFILVHSNPLLGSSLGIPLEICHKSLEEFNSLHTAFASSPESSSLDPDGNDPEASLDTTQVVDFFTSLKRSEESHAPTIELE